MPMQSDNVEGQISGSKPEEAPDREWIEFEDDPEGLSFGTQKAEPPPHRDRVDFDEEEKDE
jgi:hypothetical protein